jgi:hypothetical protein
MQILTNRWFLALMVVPLLLIKFFWVELRERAGEAPHGTSVLQGGEGWLTQRELGRCPRRNAENVGLHAGEQCCGQRLSKLARHPVSARWKL